MIKHTLYLIFAFTFFTLILTSCGGGSDSNDSNQVTICPKVINGQSCSTEGSPIVKIEVISSKGVKSLCSGSVVAATKVLTAAHCFAVSSIVSVTVEGSNTKFSVKKVTTHPELSQGGSALFNDVAIVETKQAMGLPTLPLVLSQTPDSGDKIGINGYGIDEGGDLGALKGGEMTISDVTANHISAQFNGDGSNACNGDSGGPATFTISGTVGILGITSSGIKTDCGSGDVTLFTSVQSESVLDFVSTLVPDIGTI